MVPPYDLVAYSVQPNVVNFNIASPQGNPATIPWAVNQVLERSTNNFATFDSLYFPSTSTTYADTNAFIAGVTYSYRLKLVNSINGTTSVVNERCSPVSLIPNGPPAAPQYFTSSTINESDSGSAPTSVQLYVCDNSLTETGFLMERSSNLVNWVTVQAAAPSTARYHSQVIWPTGENYIDDQHLTPGANYWYRCSATNSVGSSPYVTNTISLPANVGAGFTDWYVDASVTNGNNTGTNWANAWANPSSLNWVRLAPGNTVHIAGGDYYPGGISGAKSGSPGSPITFEASREPGHNGRVIFHGGAISISAWQYLSFEGRKDTNLTWAGLSAYNITNNINWELDGTPGAAVFTTGGNGFQVRGLEVHDVGVMTTNLGEVIPVGNKASAFFYNSDAYFTNAEIGYCYIHDVNDYAFNPNFGQAVLGQYRVHDNIMANYNGGIMRGGSMDFYRNICGPIKYPGTEHGNGLACSPNNQRIYGNIFFGGNASVLYANTHGTIPNRNFYYYNNALYMGPGRFTDGAGCFEFTCSEQTGFITFSNVVIANNTLYKVTPEAMVATSTGFGMGQINWMVANNIIVSPDDGANNDTAYFMGGNPPNQSNPTTYIFDYNLVVPPTKQINYLGVNYADGAAMAAATIFKHNSSSAPLFAAPLSSDFRLAPSDTAATGKGTNLSYLANVCTDIDKDIQGIPRGVSWDIGAYQTGTNTTTRPAAPTGFRIIGGGP
jgi:hypothetical protein